ncbi:orotidine 5'-phosphate decarboxylase [Tsukamurella pulmonis]|uniref:Orotidine 5'-phosphate decarboxylase n=2 Tax=Tsukamurella pulmonis TaxID=47312 RepID=A0A1H1FU88_9ACTN|nr:orotidine-5'-phosphate decarboxylase [Tsukamurella pulmonis]KXO87689.1 orotidine 5'-phosphate decarboxylase [Tsukamurella pulmonis]SDR04504.1 orotidine-5'-phosphate decarboxylase [Tsukamurella pulmonis]SUP18406.1 orotidine 5'-phosphate decarboxylase [Tsukamurella pulmonis]
MTFAARVAEAVAARGRLVVGIDPHPPLLAAWGLSDDAAGVRAFGLRCAEAFAGEVGFIKPQVAFFEQFGAAGMLALEEVMAACREAGAVVIADAKRGDIGSTMAGYARAWLGDSALAADAVTLSPYLGYGSLRPAIDAARAAGRGVFVLARTSNPEGAQVQADGVGQRIVDDARADNADGSGTVGLVVGATREHGLDLDGLNGPILAPGLGAQGATPADLASIFGAGATVLPNSSRQVLAAGPDTAALRSAALTVRDEVERALG